MVFNYQEESIEAYYKEARSPELLVNTSNKCGISRPTMDPPKTTNSPTGISSL